MRDDTRDINGVLVECRCTGDVLNVAELEVGSRVASALRNENGPGANLFGAGLIAGRAGLAQALVDTAGLPLSPYAMSRLGRADEARELAESEVGWPDHSPTKARRSRNHPSDAYNTYWESLE